MRPENAQSRQTPLQSCDLWAKCGQVVTDSAQFVERPAKVATGAEPQARQSRGNHVQAFHLTGLLKSTKDACSERKRTSNRMSEGLPTQSHDPEPNELSDSCRFPPPWAVPRRASPSIH